MAFPTVAGQNQAFDGTSQTSHTITLGLSPTSGDLLIFLIAFDGNPTITWNTAGWTQLFEVAVGTAAKAHGRYKTSDGTETSVSITTSVGEAKAWNTVKIQGHHTSTNPEAATATTTTKPDPPNLDPANWAAEDTLWLAWGCHDAGGADNDDISAVSASYTLVGSLNQPGTDAGAVGSGLGRRDLNASAENPGAFTTATNEDTIGATIAIRPSGAAAATSLMFAPHLSFQALIVR